MNDLDMQDLFDALRNLYPDAGDDRTLLTNLISEVKGPARRRRRHDDVARG